MLGLTFKPNTDDMRDAVDPADPRLAGRRASIAAFDPVGREQAEPLLRESSSPNSAERVADEADALVIVTEWDEFRALDLGDLADRMQEKMLIDLRNIYDRRDAEEAGLAYRGVGAADPRKLVDNPRQ